MRLLKASVLVYSGQYHFAFYPDSKKAPKYAILSHRWEEDELTFQEASDPTPWSLESNRQGHKKVVDAARKTLEYGLEWLWCDTCCIDKLSSSELSEAINSMFRWYQNSGICIAYLSDISAEPLTVSKWFERAWTLQELIAPSKLVFFDSKWQFMSTKHDRIDELVQRTRIDKTVLGEGASRLRHCSVAQKMSWAAGRIASRSEDIAYSLLGLFDVNMPMLYGEGEKAFVRLQEEIIKREADQTVFVWFPEESTDKDTSKETTNSLFALSPGQFARCNTIRQQYLKRKPFVINNLGLEIEVNLRPYDHEAYVAYLPIVNSSSPYPITLRLDVLADSHLFYRTAASLKGPRGRVGPQITQTRRITILRDHVASERSKQTLYGFRFANMRHDITLVNGWDREAKWDLGIWAPDSSSPTQSPLSCFKFSIPKGVSASIAMLTLAIGGDLFLIQLAYDFDFNPCCHVSKIHTSLQEFFSRRIGLNDDGTNWISDTVNWNQNLRHVDRYDPINKIWAAKGIDRQNFKADVPVSITRSFTRPQAQITISFAKAAVPDGEEISNAWSFELQSNLGPELVRPGGQVNIVNLRGYEGDDSIFAAREGSPMIEGLKRGSIFGPEATERFTKRVDTSPI